MPGRAAQTSFSFPPPPSSAFSPCKMLVIRSIGSGKITVEFFSAEMEFRV